MSTQLGVIEGSGGHRARDCWCSPRVCKLCPECDGSDEGCWRCDPGLIGTTESDPDDLIIIHTDERLPGPRG